MIELHERLSEFSYGYGVTREIERLLKGVGLRSVPFLPSLVQEAKLGFDVKFGGLGSAILVQFKLGQSLTRFVRQNLQQAAPPLSKPYWRFNVNTVEREGQFETLLKAELDGAETYYAAPRFVDWEEYLTFFQAEAVLEQSLLLKPSEIRAKLDVQSLPDGAHKVVYDDSQIQRMVGDKALPDYVIRYVETTSRNAQDIAVHDPTNIAGYKEAEGLDKEKIERRRGFFGKSQREKFPQAVHHFAIFHKPRQQYAVSGNRAVLSYKVPKGTGPIHEALRPQLRSQEAV